MKQYKNMALRNDGRICAVIIMILCLAIFGCAEKDDGDSDKSPIIGGWKAEETCLETYTYTSENTFLLRSKDRAQTGTYSFVSDATADGRYKLTLNISVDSPDAVDCGFASTTGQGVTSEFYVSFSNNNQTHILYSAADGARILSASRADLSVCDCGI